MRIAFLHYHLKPGGVTSVIRHQIKALGSGCETIVISGESAKEGFPAPVYQVPGLAYDARGGTGYSPEETVEKIAGCVSSHWKDGCDILHVHNAFLAKNKNLLNILKELQKRGFKLFLQLHDFAEDGRPGSYFSGNYIKNCHYGVINSRDFELLKRAGLQTVGLHKVYNTVIPIPITPSTVKNTPYVLYPVRAIRRKNIGEAVLLSLFFKNRESLYITLPPNSYDDMKSYRGWKRFTAENNLPVVFDVGIKGSFSGLVNGCSFILTTSVSEGFGFSFLEPWTAEKYIHGRMIPAICSDFQANGVKLGHLYRKINIPIRWIGKDAFYQDWRSAFIKACVLFGAENDQFDLKTQFDRMTEDGCIDFGILHESFQKIVIKKSMASRDHKMKLLALNPFLGQLAVPGNAEQLIMTNKAAVAAAYSSKVYGENLLLVYGKVKRNTVYHQIDKKKLLRDFLNPAHFSLLKWSPYER